MRFPSLIAAAALSCLVAGPVRAAERPVVVELFTSQGCSSCPPADAYLGELARGGRDVLPLAFHVTYWDRLGWRDPYGLTDATARQEVYADRFGETAFTPQLVVDGRASLVGSRRGEAAAAIARARGAATDGIPVSLRREGAGLAVSVGQAEGQITGQVTGEGRVLLVGFDRQHVTPVGRGENRGRTLTESNVVRSLRDLGAWRGGPFSAQATLPPGEDAAVIVQAADGRILGAARL